MKFNVQYHLSRYPIYLVGLILCINMYVRFFMPEIILTEQENLIYQKVMIIDKPFFLFSEIIFLGCIGYMVLHVISKNKTKNKSCYYHKLAVGILASFPTLNIIAILTPFDFTVYNSIIGKIAMFVALIFLVYFYLNREKITHKN